MIGIQILVTAFFSLIAAYLVFNMSYLLFFALAGLKKNQPVAGKARTLRKFCVLIPAYKEDVVIIETGKAAVKHQYDGEADVFVIADGLKPETISTLRANGVGVIEVSFEKSTKGKAMQTALANLPPNTYDIAMVLDADNIMGNNVLNKINLAFEEGFCVVQAHRTAKNLDTPFALLDACNEEINNQFFRKGHHAVGLSAALIGSGMAFEYSYLIKLLVGIGEVAGEDKEIDFRIVKDGVKVHYLHDAYVYDEKVANAAVFTGQRSRWIMAQIDCCRKYFGQGFVQLFRHGNFEFFDKVLQTLLLPRVLLMGVLTFMLAQSLLNPWGLSPVFWAALLFITGATLLVALPKRFYNRQLWQAIVRLPAVFFYMCLAMLKIRKTGKSFVHTPHTSATQSPTFVLDEKR